MEKEFKGIKCDNPKCDWKDMSIEWIDFDTTVKEWLNKPCPKCGANLLTEEDVESTRKMLFVMETMEEIMTDLGMNSENTEHMKMMSDGTGDKKIISESGKINFNFTKEMVNTIYTILNQPNGKEMVKTLLISKNN
jgi:hypothetical protein